MANPEFDHGEERSGKSRLAELEIWGLIGVMAQKSYTSELGSLQVDWGFVEQSGIIEKVENGKRQLGLVSSMLTQVRMMSILEKEGLSHLWSEKYREQMGILADAFLRVWEPAEFDESEKFKYVIDPDPEKLAEEIIEYSKMGSGGESVYGSRDGKVWLTQCRFEMIDEFVKKEESMEEEFVVRAIPVWHKEIYGLPLKNGDRAYIELGDEIDERGLRLVSQRVYFEEPNQQNGQENEPDTIEERQIRDKYPCVTLKIYPEGEREVSIQRQIRGYRANIYDSFVGEYGSEGNCLDSNRYMRIEYDDINGLSREVRVTHEGMCIETVKAIGLDREGWVSEKIWKDVDMDDSIEKMMERLGTEADITALFKIGRGCDGEAGGWKMVGTASERYIEVDDLRDEEESGFLELSKRNLGESRKSKILAREGFVRKVVRRHEKRGRTESDAVVEFEVEERLVNGVVVPTIVRVLEVDGSVGNIAGYRES